jgi:MerR HTH family regulatory protein
MIVDQHKRYLLPDSVACRELGISVRTLQRHLSSGKVQPPVGKLAKNRRGWTRAEIDLLREQLSGIEESPNKEALIA